MVYLETSKKNQLRILEQISKSVVQIEKEIFFLYTSKVHFQKCHENNHIKKKL